MPRLLAPLLAALLLAPAALAQSPVPPRTVKVLPVFFVPEGEALPTDEQIAKLLKHLEWSQKRYKELLRNKVTFAVAPGKPRVVRSGRDLALLRKQPENAAPVVVGELLADLKVSRFACPYVLLTVVMNPRDEFPVGGGRPLNGGVNSGGGIVQMSSFALDRVANFQCTLQHELGHAFGLPHVDVYGYDMKSNDSIMSYNPAHHTRGFEPSNTPGKLIPEDLRALALNQRVFPKLTFDPVKDVPAGYLLGKKIVPLGPMTIAGQPDARPEFATESGEDFGSKVTNLSKGQIGPNKRGEGQTFDPELMWHSSKLPGGVAVLTVTFPAEVELTRLAVYSQHGQRYAPVQGVRVLVKGASDKFRPVGALTFKSPDDAGAIPKAKGRVWRFEFQATDGQCVVLRGLRFFAGDEELFAPLVPYTP